MNAKLPSHPLFKNLTGRRFGRLVVLEYAGTRGSQKKTVWLCRCDCGQVAEIVAWCLQNGTQSCGCLQREITSSRSTTHGLSKCPEYGIWAKIIERCEKPSNKSYSNYGGRGIAMCDRWRKSFENFYADMGTRPSSKHEIDRIDTDGDYEPGNCRWATRIQNARNKRSNRIIELNGRAHCISEWAEILGWPSDIISTRLRRGWSIRKTLLTPLRSPKRTLCCGPVEKVYGDRPGVEITITPMGAEP